MRARCARLHADGQATRGSSGGFLSDAIDEGHAIDDPIIGPACGHICYQLARTINARRVFELGSGYGYSTAFFARVMRDNGGGAVHHVVWDEALFRRARHHLEALGRVQVSHV